jgi:Flp pilus assembly protein TadG
VTSLEFGVVALLFLMVLIGCMDLGRYYVIEHSLRTITAEAARAALVNPAISGTIDPTSASFAALTPFVDDANLTLNVYPSPSFIIGVSTITVIATYNFTAYSPIWSSLNGLISDSTELQY